MPQAIGPEPASPSTVGGVLDDLARRPHEYLIRRWHWKASLFSSIIRGSIFFATNVTAGLEAAYAAAGTEFAYRIVAAGCYGSLTQAFRHARPVWLANLTAVLLLPAFQHLLEFGIHLLRGTPNLKASMIASILFTVYSTLFNLYSMRRGTLVVGTGAASIWHDLTRFPFLLFGFWTTAARELWRFAQSAWRPVSAR